MTNKSHTLFIGLMSGTSLDGVDAVIVDFSKHKPSLIAQHFATYPEQLLNSVKKLCRNHVFTVDELGHTDIRLSIFYADVVKQLLEKAGIDASEITAIGSHGQTVHHSPNPPLPYTLQLGDPNQLSELTGITVVADFRRKDIAAGGQGAPLVPAFHQAIFQTKKNNRAILNIGGIANISYLPADTVQAITGFDCGPGNTLLDQYCQRHFNRHYDKDGAIARSGSVNQALLKKLLSDDYFQLPAPKSTGPEYFNLDWLTQTLEKTNISKTDTITTLCELTAKSIALCLNQLPHVNEVLICGGGIHNSYLIERLKHFTQATIDSTEKHGAHPDWVEAMAFAWLAMRTLQGLPGNIPSVTGAKRAAVLGAIYSR